MYLRKYTKTMRSLMLMAFMAVAMPIMAQNTSDHNFRVAKNLDIFNAIYRNLDLMYVDSLDADKTIGTAIRSMMRSLDPYTDYFPEDKAAEYKQMMTGKYAGIGSIISYSFTRKRVIINEPYEGMPAAEAGLKKGDIILSIDGESMAEKSTAYVSDHLRGEPGTTMVMKIERPSTGKKMTVKVQRKAIQMPYLPYYGMQKDGIGYINYNQYVENSAKDVRRAFIDLKKQGMKGLVLDLRNNGGGSVQEALQILNMFLPKGKHLLSMKGKVKNANSSYNTTVEPIDTVMPIVVLVNEATASASEITSGALQDYDRAVIMGTRTYGKGLVQIPNVSLPYNGKLKLTTAKYYIPSGRCIQALRYKHTDNGYVAENVPDSLTHEFRTAAGRIVRDGGGIKPDIEVLPDSLPNIAFYLASTGLDSTEAMLNWEVKYLKEHKTIAPAATFELSDADYEDFKAFVIQSGFKYDRESEKQLKNLVKLAKFEGYYDDARAEFDALEQRLNHNLAKDLDHNKEVIKAILAGDIVAAYYFQRGSVENKLLHDKQWKEAVKLLNDMDRYQRTLQPAPQEETAKTEGQTAKTEVTAKP